MTDPSYSLSELARRLEVPQHRLIHLCEKGIVTPDVEDAAGRGSSRRFSERNYFELAVALRMRDLMLPLAMIGVALEVLRRFEGHVGKGVGDFRLPRSLAGEDAPDLRLILADGRDLYFSLAAAGEAPALFGGIPLDEGDRTRVAANWPVQGGKAVADSGFGEPEGSTFGRIELSLTEVARSLT